MKHPGLLALVFVIGCATGGVAAQMVIPAARAGTNPQRFEHLCTQGATDKQLAEAGAEGWEMVSAFASQYRDDWQGRHAEARQYAFCFKRPLPSYDRPGD